MKTKCKPLEGSKTVGVAVLRHLIFRLKYSASCDPRQTFPKRLDRLVPVHMGRQRAWRSQSSFNKHNAEGPELSRAVTPVAPLRQR